MDGRDGASTPPYVRRYRAYAASPHRSDAASLRGSVSSYTDFPNARHPMEGFASPRGTVPQTNSRAVISALKGLQEKIRKLELERADAEDNLKSLAVESRHYKEVLQKEHSAQKASEGVISKQNKDLEDDLQSAEARCNLLEKQLDYMRKMVQTAEMDRDNAIQRSTILAQHTAQHTSDEIRGQLDKLSGLERDHMKLTATQSIAESKIRELEERLREEEHHRKMMVDKTAELQTVAETNRILMHMASPPPPKIKKKKKKKVQKSKPRKQPQVVRPSEHYRLNLGNIPFVVGKSTGKSHAVGANIQTVLSMMKNHNPALCNAVTRVQRQYEQSSGSSSSHESEQGLEELLLGLQDEFGHMSFEHQELARQIQDTDDLRIKEDLERELEHLVTKMEAKGEQIAMVRRHQQGVKKKRVQFKTHKARPAARPKSASAVLPADGGEVQVITTVKTRSRGKSAGIDERQRVGTESKLKVLKGMKTLQNSLTKDDLHWD